MMDLITSSGSHFFRLPCNEQLACVGVDLQFVGCTPAGERVRINYYSEDALPGLDDAVLECCGLKKPFFERPGQIVGILEDAQ